MVGSVLEIGDRHLLHLRLSRSVEPEVKMVEEAPIFLGAIGQFDHLEIRT